MSINRESPTRLAGRERAGSWPFQTGDGSQHTNDDGRRKGTHAFRGKRGASGGEAPPPDNASAIALDAPDAFLHPGGEATGRRSPTATPPGAAPVELHGSAPLTADPDSQDPGSEVGNADVIGLDWMTITFIEEGIPGVQDALAALHDGDEGQPGGGRKVGHVRYTKSLEWEDGLQIDYATRSGRARLDVPGRACARLGFARLLWLARVAMDGGSCTRVDIRRDIVGRGQTLVGDVYDACERGELCRLRQFDQVAPRDAKSLRLLGRTVYIGSRQDSHARIYDKGLERGWLLEGQWTRYEVELRAERAHEALMAMLEAPSIEAAGQVALSTLLGFADFREVTGDPNIERRPRPEFWRRFVEHVETRRPRISRPPTTAPGCLAWYRDAVAPRVLAVARLTELTVGEVVAELFAAASVTAAILNDGVTRDLAEYVQAEREARLRAESKRLRRAV